MQKKKNKEEEGEYNSHLVETQLDEQCEKMIPTFGTVSFFSFFFFLFLMHIYLPLPHRFLICAHVMIMEYFVCNRFIINLCIY